MLKEILDREFRANPGYRLVAYERLAPAEQERLQPLGADGDFYGVLLSDGPAKAIDPETALLLFTLQNPGPIPGYVRQRFGGAANQAVAQLVLDDILQVADGGLFVSGAAAHAVVFGAAAGAESGASAAGSHPLARLAANALRYAERLPPMPHGQLALRLYMYNTMPLSLRWTARLPDEAAVVAWLGIDARLERAWQRQRSAPGGGWLSWQRRGLTPQPLPYKLYVSPRPADLPGAFAPVVDVLARHGVPSFKVGRDLHGILRPDKLVCYLPDFAALAAVAQALQEALAGCAAQGVPFTAPIDSAGLLSWGMDPPAAAQVFAGSSRESWRFWIAERLAAALQTAAAGGGSVPPWRYALDRLRLEGLDTERWIPGQKMWARWGSDRPAPPAVH